VFGVKPQFSLAPASSSIFGCTWGLLIAGAAIVFFILTIINASNYQIFISQDFQ
jgi:hypothetical protein